MSDLIEHDCKDKHMDEFCHICVGRMEKQIERLTAEREKFAAAWLRVDEERLKVKLEVHNLQARVEALEAALQKIRTEPGNARDCRYIAGHALAATEQEVSDE